MKKAATKRRQTATPRSSRSAIELVLNGVRRLERGLRLAARDVERSTRMSSAQLFVLEQLSRKPAASIGELASRTMTDRSSVSVVVDRLAAAKLVSRVQSTGDRRRAEVRITKAGREVLQRAPLPPAHQLVSGLKRMRPAAVRQLGETLQQLNVELGFSDARMLFEE